MGSKQKIAGHEFFADYLTHAALFFIIVALFVSAALLVQNSKTVSIFVAEPPIVANIDGHKFLSYEVFVSDYSPFTPSKLEVIDNNDHVIYTISDDALNKTLYVPANGMNKTAIRLWIDLAPHQIPANLTHRLYFANSFIVAKGAFTPVISKPLPVIAPPMRPANWIAMNGPSAANPHRNAIFELNGKIYVAQRFAIDWVIVDEAGSWSSGTSANTDYYAYGKEILAVGDGTIVAMQDGVKDNVPKAKPPVAISTLGGNYVVLDLHNGYYAFYGHMIPGSLRVKNGDNVTTGQVIGLLGNAGNSDAAHLHFHMCDSMDYLFCHGQPYEFSSYSATQIFTANPPALVDSPVFTTYTNSMPGDLDVVKWK